MKRLVAMAGIGIIVALVGCGQPPPPENPTLHTDVDSVGFNAEFCAGVYVGTEIQDNVQVINQGQNDLVISDVSITGGDNAFRVSTVSATPVTVKGLKTTFVALFFKPTEAKRYTATLKISSNDPKLPVKELQVSGRGVPPPVPTDLDAGTLPQGPKLQVDRTAIDFTVDSCQQTTVGKQYQVTVTLTNPSLSNLTVNSAIVSGDPAMSVTSTPTLPVTLAGVGALPDGGVRRGADGGVLGTDVSVAVLFSPTAAKAYSGTLTINSNAPSGGTVTIPLTGTGL